MGSPVGKQTCLHKGWVPDLLVHQKRACSGTMHPKVPMDTFDEKNVHL